MLLPNRNKKLFEIDRIVRAVCQIPLHINILAFKAMFSRSVGELVVTRL